MPPPGFDAEEYARVERAAHLAGKDPLTFVRDAALKAAEDPFLKALGQAADTVARLAVVFDAGTAENGRSSHLMEDDRWDDQPPMSSLDLHDQPHGRAA